MIPLPAETHQQGAPWATAADVTELLVTFMGQDAAADASAVTVAQLGLSDADVWELWRGVCEELGERSLGPELDPTSWGSATTLWQLATVMASTLAGTGTGTGAGDGDDEGGR